MPYLQMTSVYIGQCHIYKWPLHTSVSVIFTNDLSAYISQCHIYKWPLYVIFTNDLCIDRSVSYLQMNSLHTSVSVVFTNDLSAYIGQGHIYKWPLCIHRSVSYLHMTSLHIYIRVIFTNDLCVYIGQCCVYVALQTYPHWPDNVRQSVNKSVVHVDISPCWWNSSFSSSWENKFWVSSLWYDIYVATSWPTHPYLHAAYLNWQTTTPFPV